MKTRSKKIATALAIILVLLSLSIASTPWPPDAEAGYASRTTTDSWGDKITITANYNIGGGHVDYKAVSGKATVKFFGITLGCYICTIKTFYIYLKCYDSAGNVIKSYSRTYYPSRTTYSKSVSVPAGTTRIYAKMSAKFLLLISPFPTRTLSLSLYA